MRVEVTGILKNTRTKIVIDSFEEYDAETDLMAMEKWTGWHASIVMQHVMNKKNVYGAYPIEKAITGKEFYQAALKRNYKIKINKTVI